ncbi:hypothetical protein [Levilactobacillus sp. N40-8-2]|uniref:hypothetical protein n=1 Tax=Levilactobacillus muriae TaxID=3238987 RepID=UPI0038B297BF
MQSQRTISSLIYQIAKMEQQNLTAVPYSWLTDDPIDYWFLDQRRFVRQHL